MIKIIHENVMTEVDKIIQRGSLTLDRKEEPIVKDILSNIFNNKDKALLEYTNKFDKTSYVSGDDLRVSEAEIRGAIDLVSPEIIETLRRAIANIEAHHRQQVHPDWSMETSPGAMTGLRYTALESVGVYVPGGTAAYPSTVLMNVIPAKVAGVGRIVMVTPPSPDGEINPVILAAAALLDVKEIYKIGGAQAVGALAFGTETIAQVDKIVGPGNIWVTLAKKQVYGIVAIDKLAGPSDITVLADATAPIEYIAADMLSQAEHDVLASAIAVVLDLAQAEQIKLELMRQTETLTRKEIVRESLANYGAIFVVKNIEEMALVGNKIAPEHMELMFEDPSVILEKIRNAGAIFCGYYSPEPLGDYFAGTNHVLPTGSTSRFESPLGVDDFVKKTSIVHYTREAASRVIDDIERFALLEGFDAHARSMTIRR